MNQHFENFRRFHFYISPYTVYYPTCGQLMSLVAPARPDQTIVIIGGTSLFNGFGQNADELWSEHLKKKLGDKYYVVNLAFDGASSFECGSWVAEMLIKQNRKVIFTTTVEPTHMVSPDGLLLKQVFLQFRSRNLLLDCGMRNKFIDKKLNQWNANADSILIENDLGTRVDQFTYSSELWQWVGHNLFFTVWCYGTHPNFLKPRGLYADTFVPNYNRNLDFYEKKKNVIVAEQTPLVSRRDGALKPNESMWRLSDHKAEAVPDELLRHSIIFVPRYNPDLTDRFSPSEREIYDAVLNISVSKWQSRGADSVILGTDFTSSSYCDMGHFSPSGAALVADIVADRIRENAKRLEYE